MVSNQPTELAKPFSQIFSSEAEAHWAFDFLWQTAKALGLSGPADQRLALTLTGRGGQPGLHLTYGSWLVIGFRGGGQVELLLLTESIAWDERFATLPAEAKEGWPEVRSYLLPLAYLRPMTSGLQSAWAATLAFVAEKFHGWKRAIPWKKHQTELVEALFDRSRRQQLFAAGLAEPELLYERQLTAFYHDISEETEGYEVEKTSDDDESGTVSDINQTKLDRENKMVNSPHFEKKAFDLLAELHQSPTKDFYQANKLDFLTYLENPFKALLYDIADRLPSQIRETMETETRLFSQITKNDFGQGGAWDFYWGAFYRQGGKRTSDAQLSMWINYQRLEFGFYIGDYGKETRKRLVKNCQANYEFLINALKNILTDPHIFFGNHQNISVETGGSVVSRLDLTWQEWLRNPAAGEFDASFVLTKDEVLSYSTKQLSETIASVYAKLFPLVLAAIHDDPLPAIKDYLAVPTSKPVLSSNKASQTSPSITHINPPYPLPQLAENTGFPEAELARWVRAIERKGQAILYGPPGTGKTYLAEQVARHLIGGGAGFSELVQFHPAYAYEDFMQGIRPRSGTEGQLTYELEPGRFLDFCRRAAARRDVCVLIIDEINRANLARVFGELMYLLEYRAKQIPLAGGGAFQIPANVRLIGTMNTADRSIALVDYALRRRFAFLPLAPNYQVLRHFHHARQTGFAVEGLITILRRLNAAILDEHYFVGIAFFLHENLSETLEDIWRMEIEPYLEEFFFDQPERVADFRWEKIAGEIEASS